jgi:hypothetical protein
MRNTISSAGLVILLFLMLNSTSQSEQLGVVLTDCTCAEKALTDIRSIKVGMTRRELKKVLTTEGGLSTRGSRTYVYGTCQYIKVDVQFQAIQHTSEKLKEFPDDKIVGISKPYLEYPILD